jgi:CRISPR-associated protein Cas5d
MRWVVHSIEVLRPIRFVSVRRNEIQSKVAPKTIASWIREPRGYQPQPAGAGSSDATPRGTLALRDVAYVIEAEPIVFERGSDNTPAKYVAMLSRRAENGQCFHAPYLGCREFSCSFGLDDGRERPISDSRDLGLMLYDIAFGPRYENNKPVFFAARLEEGVVLTSPENALPNAAQREEVLRCWFRL